MSWHTRFLCLRQFGTGILADNQVGERFAHSRGNRAAQSHKLLFSNRTRHGVESPREQERLTCQGSRCCLLLLLHIDTPLPYPLDHSAILLILQPAITSITAAR